jgi:hypothetical protein
MPGSSVGSGIAALIGAWEWSAITITAWSSRKRSTPPAGAIIRASCWSAAAIERTCASGPYLWETQSLSGSEKSMKSKRSCSTMCAPTQPLWRSRTPGIPSPERHGVRRLAKTSA